MADDEPLEAADDSEPVRALADFAEEPPTTLRPRVRRSIQRRLFASDVADLTLVQVFQVFMELLKVVFETLTGKTTSERERE